MRTSLKPLAVVIFGASLLSAQLPNPLGLPDPLHLSDSQGLPNPLNLPDPLGLSKPRQGAPRVENRHSRKHHVRTHRRKHKKLRKHDD